MPTLRPIVRYGSYNHIVVCVMCVCLCALFFVYIVVDVWLGGIILNGAPAQHRIYDESDLI